MNTPNQPQPTLSDPLKNAIQQLNEQLANVVNLQGSLRIATNTLTQTLGNAFNTALNDLATTQQELAELKKQAPVANPEAKQPPK
jgi:hypothetical protein